MLPPSFHLAFSGVLDSDYRKCRCSSGFVISYVFTSSVLHHETRPDQSMESHRERNDEAWQELVVMREQM